MGWFTRKQQQQPAQVLAPKGPGWLSRAWNAYRDYRIERAGAVRNRKELEQFLERDRLGFWEQNGYNNRADPWKEERFW